MIFQGKLDRVLGLPMVLQFFVVNMPLILDMNIKSIVSILLVSLSLSFPQFSFLLKQSISLVKRLARTKPAVKDHAIRSKFQRKIKIDDTFLLMT